MDLQTKISTVRKRVVRVKEGGRPVCMTIWHDFVKKSSVTSTNDDDGVGVDRPDGRVEERDEINHQQHCDRTARGGGH